MHIKWCHIYCWFSFLFEREGGFNLIDNKYNNIFIGNDDKVINLLLIWVTINSLYMVTSIPNSCSTYCLYLHCDITWPGTQSLDNCKLITHLTMIWRRPGDQCCITKHCYYYYYHLFILKIIWTVVQLFTSVDKSNYKVHRSFNKNSCSSSLRLDSEIPLMQSKISVINSTLYNVHCNKLNSMNRIICFKLPNS